MDIFVFDAFHNIISSSFRWSGNGFDVNRVRAYIHIVELAIFSSLFSFSSCQKRRIYLESRIHAIFRLSIFSSILLYILWPYIVHYYYLFSFWKWYFPWKNLENRNLIVSFYTYIIFWDKFITRPKCPVHNCMLCALVLCAIRFVSVALLWNW